LQRRQRGVREDDAALRRRQLQRELHRRRHHGVKCPGQGCSLPCADRTTLPIATVRGPARSIATGSASAVLAGCRCRGRGRVAVTADGRGVDLRRGYVAGPRVAARGPARDEGLRAAARATAVRATLWQVPRCTPARVIGSLPTHRRRRLHHRPTRPRRGLRAHLRDGQERAPALGQHGGPTRAPAVLLEPAVYAQASGDGSTRSLGDRAGSVPGWRHRGGARRAASGRPAVVLRMARSTGPGREGLVERVRAGTAT
jgi:hypothetical protein